MSKTYLAQVTPEGDHGCPCGRSHPSPWKRRRRSRTVVASGDLKAKAYEAFTNGKAETVNGFTVLHYAGSCRVPIVIKRHSDRGAFSVAYEIRCRACPACLRARMGYWASAAMHQTRLAASTGLRTWFGTLTLSSEAQANLLGDARDEWLALYGERTAIPEWWQDPACDFRFGLVRKHLVRELQRYWKRLRKAGHAFSYLAVIERHKTGLPHVHFLLHEKLQSIRKRDIQEQWPFGFSNVSIVGGNAARAAGPDKAAWYVVKYLSKSRQARQMASKGYRPTPIGKL